MLHFGTLDRHIPKQDIDRVQAAHPEVKIFWYDADHGFNCNDRSAPGRHKTCAGTIAGVLGKNLGE